jgi:hypothetical protein
LPLVLFCHPHGAARFSSLVRDVEASRCSAAFVVAFASALRCATPAAVSQSDSASGAGLVFIASSAAAAACAAAAAAAVSAFVVNAGVVLLLLLELSSQALQA